MLPVTAERGMRSRRALALATVLCSLAMPGVGAAQGLTLDAYRAAETTNDGFVVTRPRGIGHFGTSASLHLDYGLEPLRGPASLAGGVLVDHQLSGQLGVGLGLFDRLVIAVRMPVVLVLSGRASAAGDPMTRDPGATGAGVGDLALSLRGVLVDEPLFGLAIQTEATVPTAEALASSQDLAGEAGASFTPELAAELRFEPVRITANVGARFRQAASYQTLRVANEITWALGVGVDIVPDVFDATIEGYGSTPQLSFGSAALSPVEVLLGLRVRPIGGLVIGLAGGPGLGDGYGTPVFRGALTIGYSDRGASWTPGGEGPEPTDAAVDVEASESTSDADATRETSETSEAAPAVAPEPAPADAERSRVTPPDPSTYGQLDRDGDRLVDAEDRCILDREDYDEIEDADGCPEENADSDPVADAEDVCPLTPGVATTDPTTTGCPERAYIGERGAIVIRDRVEFATGSDRILRASEAVLNDVLSILSSSPDVTRVRIEGHTDDQGTDRANIRLSRARAASVRRWLVTHGIAVERLEAWGCGEFHPLTPGTTRAIRQANRRVEFFVVQPRSADLVLRDRCVEAP